MPVCDDTMLRSWVPTSAFASLVTSTNGYMMVTVRLRYTSSICQLSSSKCLCNIPQGRLGVHGCTQMCWFDFPSIHTLKDPYRSIKGYWRHLQRPLLSSPESPHVSPPPPAAEEFQSRLPLGERMEPANRISNTNQTSQTSQLSMFVNSVEMDKATRKLLLLHARLCSAVHCAVSPHLDNFEVATAKIHHVLNDMSIYAWICDIDVNIWY